jgi:hypothetical protein
VQLIRQLLPLPGQFSAQCCLQASGEKAKAAVVKVATGVAVMHANATAKINLDPISFDMVVSLKALMRERELRRPA